MNGSAIVAVPVGDEMTVWRLVESGQPPPRLASRRVWLLRMGVFCLGLLATAVGAGAAWERWPPDTIVSTRILADATGEAAGRAVLSDFALRLAGSADPAIQLENGGDSLVVTARDRDPKQAEQRSRSLVEAILNAPVAAAALTVADEPVASDVLLRAERTRLAVAADAIEARSMAISASLTGLARDAASASRNAADHRPGRETLDKGNAAMADLRLQRLQLVAKYQDTYPAVLALDSQISNLHVFLMEEAHRIEARPAAADPADAMLAGERDRLQAETVQLDDRRRVVAADLANTDRKLAALPPSISVVAAPVVAPSAVLIAAATTRSSGEDMRMVWIPAIAAIGLVVSGLAALLVRRRTWLPGGVMLAPVSERALSTGSLRHLPLPMTTSLHMAGAVRSLQRAGLRHRA